MIVDLVSNDCIVLITDINYEHYAKIAISYLLKYTDFDIVLYTGGYHSTISNPRINIRKFEFASGNHLYNSVNFCKAYVALDLIDNSDYDRFMYFDCDMIFTEKVANIFNYVRGYLQDTPLYAIAPLRAPFIFDDDSGGQEDRFKYYYDFIGRTYSPEYICDPWKRIWYRMGCAYMFNKSCRNFYQDVVCQIKTAVSHPDHSEYLQMYSLNGLPDLCSVSAWKYPMNAEECYMNATVWKNSNERNNMWVSSSYLPCFIQELIDEDHFEWLSSASDREASNFPNHPLWKNRVTYSEAADSVHGPQWFSYPYLGVTSEVVEPISYHFSKNELAKEFMIRLHEQLGGHDESIFNC